MMNFKQVQLFVWFGLILKLISSTSAKLCPPQEAINPCFCVSDGKDIRIDCIRVNSVTDLRQAFRGLQGQKDVFIDLLRCRLPEIPPDLFSGLHIITLSFTQCEISEKSELSFTGLDHSLKDLSITFSFPEHNGLTLLKTSNLQSLNYLQIEGNSVKKLGNDWFHNGPKNLKNLFIMTNDIEEIDSEAFVSLGNLNNLWITGNKLSTIRRSIFPRPATQLVTLDLADNKISELPADLFSDMPSLKDVTFSGNEIKTLPGTVWSTIWKQLTRVYISDNPLHCDESLQWMLRISRPYVLKGQCASPANMKGKELKQLIDEAKEEPE